MLLLPAAKSDSKEYLSGFLWSQGCFEVECSYLSTVPMVARRGDQIPWKWAGEVNNGMGGDRLLVQPSTALSLLLLALVKVPFC